MPATAKAKPHEIAQYHYLADAMRGLERDPAKRFATAEAIRALTVPLR